jgi:multidrug efflux system outer membrane protein
MKANLSTTRVAKSCLGTLLPALLIAGCTLGPDYKKPELTVPNTFRSEITASDARSFADLPWWSVFDDRALQGIVTQALANNNDLQIAVARIEQARAIVGVAQSQG